MRWMILAGLVALASPALSEAPVLPPQARDAAAVVDGFHAALLRGDTAAAAALLADDALMFEAGSVERTKAEYAAHHLPADAEFSKAVDSQIIRRSGDARGGVAWLATEGRSRGTFRGKAVHQLTTETMVLQRLGGSWKIRHIHWSSRAQPASRRLID